MPHYATLMKCHVMWYFIWVFAVCLSTHLGVSGLQQVNKVAQIIVKLAVMITRFPIKFHDFGLVTKNRSRLVCVSPIWNERPSLRLENIVARLATCKARR